MEGLEVFSTEELKVIQEFFDVLAKRTRKTQKISNKRKITIIESWKKYDPKAVISALKVYISMKATSTQNEKYVLGIIRNKHKELGGIAYDRNSRSDEQSKAGSQEKTGDVDEGTRLRQLVNGRSFKKEQYCEF